MNRFAGSQDVTNLPGYGREVRAAVCSEAIRRVSERVTRRQRALTYLALLAILLIVKLFDAVVVNSR